MIRKIIFALSLLVTAIALSAAPASAEEAEKPRCSGLLMLSLQAEYPLQDLGVDASAGKPVTQNMVAVTCGKLSADVWTSTGVDTPGTYGKRGGADEIDFELAYDDKFNVDGLGELKGRLYVGYFALDLGEGLGGASDDYVQVYGEVAKSFKVSTVTVEPYVRAMRMIGVGKGEDFSILRLGARVGTPVKLPVVGDSRFSGEVAHAWNGAGGDKSIWRGEAFVSKAAGGGWTVHAGGKVTENIGFTPVFKLTKSF